MYKNYRELKEEVNNLYELNKIEEALLFLTKGVKELSKQEYMDNYFYIMMFKVKFNYLLKDYKNSFSILKELVENGYPCYEDYFNMDVFKDFEGLENIKKKNTKLLNALEENVEMEYEVYLPNNYNKNKQYPVLFAFHGDGVDCNIKGFKKEWPYKVFNDNEIIVVYVQSSQMCTYNGHGWLRDLNKARKDISKCFEIITEKYSINKDKVIVGGFSGGAIISLDIVFSNTIPVKGFIALSPEIKTDSCTIENVIAAKSREVKGVIMEGEKVLPMKDETEVMNMFDKVNLEYEYYINKDVGHEFPHDFDAKLEKSIEFIL